MKVTQNQPPIQPKPFYPVSITLETQEEINSVYATLRQYKNNSGLCVLGENILTSITPYTTSHHSKYSQ